MASEEAKVSSTIEEILGQIIDEWYNTVAPHYITQVKPGDGSSQQEELKRFHDEKGHRIKFNKEELDFTYGLRSQWEIGHYVIEISVNNKVQNFDYEDFQRRLFSHYDKMQGKKVPTPFELRDNTYQQIFLLDPNREEAFDVERYDEKADIMRLSFRVSDRFIQSLASHPVASKKLIEDYCVSPFRSVYAAVYRRQLR